MARDLGGDCGEIHTGDLHCIGADLADTDQISRRLFGNKRGDEAVVGGREERGGEALLKCEVATLVVTECVLQYMEAEQLARLLSWVRCSFPMSIFVR